MSSPPPAPPWGVSVTLLGQAPLAPLRAQLRGTIKSVSDDFVVTEIDSCTGSPVPRIRSIAIPARACDAAAESPAPSVSRTPVTLPGTTAAGVDGQRGLSEVQRQGARAGDAGADGAQAWCRLGALLRRGLQDYARHRGSDTGADADVRDADARGSAGGAAAGSASRGCHTSGCCHGRCGGDWRALP